MHETMNVIASTATTEFIASAYNPSAVEKHTRESEVLITHMLQSKFMTILG